MIESIIKQIKSSNLTWLYDRTILLVRHGSHAYGTNIPTSDLDVKGICVPPKEYFHGFQSKFEQAEFSKPDAVMYDIRKFFNLASDCNPNIIEVLFTDESDRVIVTKLGSRLLDIRDKFISKKARHTFSGYALAQLKRINTHYKWIKNPPKSKPTRKGFNLPETPIAPKEQIEAAESEIRKKLDGWDVDVTDLDPASRIAIQNKISSLLTDIKVFDKYTAAGASLGYDTNFLVLLQSEREYKAKMAEWHQYQNWKETRNPTRSALEDKFGYDTKHAMHLVRLLRMCREILSGKGVIVRRPDKDELLAIRNGAWTYEQLVEWAHSEDKAMVELYNKSPLPNSPDRKFLEAKCMELVEDMLWI